MLDTFPITAIATRATAATPRCTATVRKPRHSVPITCRHFTLPRIRMPASTIEKINHWKPVRTKHNLRNARVCSGLWGLTLAIEKAPVHCSIRGKQRSTASSNAELAGVAIPSRKRQSNRMMLTPSNRRRIELSASAHNFQILTDGQSAASFPKVWGNKEAPGGSDPSNRYTNEDPQSFPCLSRKGWETTNLTPPAFLISGL